MSLGEISSSVPGKMRALAFGGGALAGGWAGGIATAGLPDLRVTPNEALNYEAAKFGTMQATGSFGSFQNIMDSAKTDFNVQNQQAFMQSIVAGTQRGGMVGLMGGGTVGERRAGTIIGGFSSLAGMAGIDQSTVGSTMNSMYGATAYYSALAAGVQTRNPVTGELASAESMVNQLWANTGMKGKSGQDALTQIDIDYGYAGQGRAQLMQMFGGDENAVQSVIEGMRIRAQNEGKALTAGQIEEQSKEAGILGTKETQGLETARALESANLGLTAEYAMDVTTGFADAAEKITEAVNLLADLEGPLRTIVGKYMEIAAELDTFQTEVPGMTKDLTNFFGGLPGAILMALGGKSLLGGALKTGAGVAARGAGAAALSAAAPLAIPAAALVGTTLAVGAVGTWAVNRYTDYPEHGGSKANSAIARNAGTNTRSSGYGSYAEGEWNVESDQIARIHHGEMVLPNRVASAVREELALGQTSGPVNSRTSPKKGGEGTTVNIYLTVQRASDQEAVQFAHKVKRLIDDDQELLSIGSGRF